MKRIIVALLLLLGFGSAAFALGPVPSYQWDFNLANVTSGTNFVNSTVPGGDLQGSAATTQEGVLTMLTTSGVKTNLLGLPGSGVGTNALDRAISLLGSYGGNGPVAITTNLANCLTNVAANNGGILTNFTITAWIKADGGPITAFPRVLILGPQGQDIGAVNSLGLLFFTGTGAGSEGAVSSSVQLKVNNNGNVDAYNNFLTPYLNDWFFIAVTYDSTIDTTAAAPGGTNVFFYIGDRFNSLGAGTPAKFNATSLNSVAPAATTGPGYINFSTNLNGDGATFSVPSNHVWVAIGNNPARGRAFNGRYDDVRFYANQVLSQSDLDLVRQDPGLQKPGRLTVTSQPKNTTVAEGQGAAFTVGTTPAPNITYQWYRFNPGSATSNNIVGATNQTYETPALTVASDNGSKYGVRVHSTDPFADYNGTGTNSINALATVVATNSLVVTPGMLKFEYFQADGGSSVANFFNSPSANYTNNTPDLTLYVPTFDSRAAFPDDSHNNYFARISGWITPTVTTNYVFFIRAGDTAQLYLSMASGSTSNLLCSDTANGLQVYAGAESQTSAVGGQYSAPVALTAGTSYPVYAYLKVSGGINGLVQVAWRMNSDPSTPDQPANDANLADRLQPIPSSVLSTLALPGGTVSISSSPANASVVAGAKATFNAGGTTSFSTSNYLSGPVVIQWRKNGVNIDGATGASYTTPYLTPADNGSTFRAVVSIPGVSNQTASATLTVNADNVPPTVVGATAGESGHSVKVQFSEPVDAATALNPANYSIPGITIVGANFVRDTNLVDNPTYDTVRLITTNVLSDNTSYTVTVSNVKDTAVIQNTIGSGNTATFRSLGFYPGVVKFEYFEAQTYTSLAGLDVNGFVTYSPKFLNNDPDTVVFPTSAEMSPDGTPTIRSSGGGNLFSYPPYYGTRLSTLFVPPVTTNYVFYVAADDTALLWLSTDENPANKHVIAWQSSAAAKRNWSQNANAHTDTFATNLVGSSVTVPDATPWPVADANGYATITLTAGQRYYLELDHLENAGFSSLDAATYTTAADNATVTAPGNGSAPALTGSVIGWRFPLPQITSFSNTGGAVSIAWTNSLNQINLGALGYPGLGNITAAFPSTALQSASVVTGPYTTLTNTSPATIPTTSPAQFFRIGE